MAQPDDQSPRHGADSKGFWTRYALGTAVLLFLLVIGTPSDRLALAAPTFDDYWVGVPMAALGCLIFLGGLKGNSWLAAVLGTLLFVVGVGFLVLVGNPYPAGVD